MLFRNNPNIKRSLFRKIVNGFIYFGLGVIIAFMLLFAISQTSTFRQWLREKIVTTVNGSINGHLYIERIDGTVFTEIILNNTLLMQDTDTLLFAKKIILRTSPLEIFFKTIYFRKIEISDANISFLKDIHGNLNISKLIKPSEVKTPEDSTSSEFSFKIRVADLTLKNVDFNLYSYSLKYSRAVYENINPDDLRLNNINLSLNAFANISKKDLRLSILSFSAGSNISGFQLKNFSGDFFIDRGNVGATGLNIKTSRSNLSLNIIAKNFHILGAERLQLERVPFRFDLKADDFNFDDLTNFITGTEILQGSVNTQISARGTLNNLSVKKLNVGFNNTRINGKGSLKRITDGGRMMIDMNLSESVFGVADPDTLFRNIDIPVFKGYSNLVFDTLHFKGEPLNFTSDMYVKTERGDFDGIVSMDLTQDDMVYDVTLFTQNLDLQPVINLPTNLNSHITLKGKGTSPDRMKTNLSITANWSEIKNKLYQNLNLKLFSQNANLKYDLSFKSDTASGNISGGINFANVSDPAYNLKASLHNINFANIIPESNLNSDFNLTIEAEGNSFNPDSLELFAVIGIDSSKIDEIRLDEKKVIVDLRNDFENGRVINVVSNLADITMSGKFSVLDISSIIGTEATLITDFIEHNLKKINPLEISSIDTSTNFLTLPENLFDVNYSIEFKDFELLSLLLGNIDMEIDGDINGLIKRNGDTLSVSALMDVNYFKFIKDNELFFLSGLKLNAEMINDFSIGFPQSFSTNINLSLHDIFLNEKYHDISLNTSINHNYMSVKFGGQIDNYLSSKLNGYIIIEDSIANLFLDSLYIKYNDLDLWNTEKIDIAFTDERFQINNFKMTHAPGEIEIAGLFSLTDDQNLSIHVNNFRGKELSNKIFYLPKGTSIGSRIDLSAFLQGTIQAPLMNMNMTADSIVIRNKKIGTLITSAAYNKGELKFSLNILDTLYNINAPIFKAGGSIPIKLPTDKTEEVTEKNVHFSLLANQFDLTTITGIVSPLKELEGKFDADIEVSGTTEDLNLSGSAEVNNVSFIANLNNIKYQAYAKVLFEEDEIILDRLYLKNEDGYKGGGTIAGYGKIGYDNFEFGNIEIHADGQLKILAKETRAVNPAIYGDLAIKTNGEIRYINNSTRNSFSGDLIITKGADVTITRKRSPFSNSSDKFVYRFKEPTGDFDESGLIDSLIILSDIKSKREGIEPSRPGNLNLNIKINIEDEAKVVFELSPEFKQNLTAYLDGSFEYNITNENSFAQGELQLLEGSKLEFIKPFDAVGSVKFISQLDDPYLDITGTYRDYYQLPTDSVSSNTGEREVEIRIKLEGLLSELDKNFIQQEGNINVYMRENALSDFQLDATKTSSDAIMFIIAGKFTDDATSQDRNFAASTVTSFAGSLTGALLNQAFGDYVRSVRFQQVGTETKVSLIGKAGDLRYEIGGTSQVFQDLSRANVKVELPINSLGGLVLRLQRREPLEGTATYGEMINEFGVKYRFDF